MGLMNTLGLIESGIDMESAIAMHLRGNHYPPVPSSMVSPCIEAIDAYWEENLDKEIELDFGLKIGMDNEKFINIFFCFA